MSEMFLKDLIQKPISGEWGIEGNSVKVIRTTNFTNEGKLNLTDVALRYIDEKKVQNKKLQNDDIIIEKSGGGPKQPVGRVVFFDEMTGEYLCNNFTSILRPKKDLVFPKYLLYILFANHKYGFTGAFQNKTTGIINLKLARYLNEIQVPLPPLWEQKKIAAVLGAADGLRQNDKALIAKYDELTQSLFLDMFGDTLQNPMGWEKRILETICSHIVDCPHSTPKYVEEVTEFPCIRTTELKNGSIDWAKMKYLNTEAYSERIKRLKPVGGDIVYGREGSYGDAVIIPAGIKLSLGQRVMLFRPIYTIMNSQFMHAVVRSKGVYSQAQRVNAGSTVGHVNIKDIRKFNIIVPPFDLQNQFADRIQSIDSQKAKAQESLDKSEALFNSLLQKAFKGELTN